MYLFNHIPKCAGLSYRALFEDLFGKDRVTHITISREEEHTPDPAVYRDFTVLMGHFGVRWNDIVGPGRKWMTVLREPVDRVISTYYFWRHNAPLSPESPWLYLAQTKSLDGFVRSGHYTVRKGIENLQTRQIAEDLRWTYRTLSERDALEVAKENLGKFDFIGLYEEFEQSFERLCRFLGTQRPRAIPRVNVTKKRDSMTEIPQATLDAIRELNRADLELYDYARKLFYGQVNASDARPAEPKRLSCSMLPAAFKESKALRLRTLSIPPRCSCKDVIEAVVEISNDGANVWSSRPPNPFFISYHWFNEAGEVVELDGWRSEIRPELQPFSTGRFRVHIVAPATPGVYRLRITPVQEFVRWFDEPSLFCFEDTRMLVEDTAIENAVFSPTRSAVRL